MSRERIRELDRQLGRVLVPRIEAEGFVYKAPRTGRRTSEHPEGSIVEIINCQVGIKSLAGRFTINLAVFHDSRE